MPISTLSPERLLVVLLAVLAISLIQPQAAYPLVGSALGAVIAAAAALLLIRWQETAWKGLTALSAVALLLAFAWSAWWLGGWLFVSEVPVLGTFAVGTTLQVGCAFVAFVAVFALLPDDWNPRHLVVCWLIAVGALVSLHGIYQVTGPGWMPYTFASRLALIEAEPNALPEATREGILHALREGRASGVFGSPNVFAGFLAMMLPLAIAFAFERVPRALRIGCGVAAVILLAGIVMTGSRGGLLAAVVGIAAVGVLLLPRLTARGTATALLAIMLLGAASAPGFFERWTGVSTVQQRFLYWDSAIAIWSEAPLVGHGPGGFELHYPFHRDPRANETRFAHNWIFQWGTEVGILGLALFLGWMGVVLAGGLAWWRKAGRDPLSAGLIAALVVLLAHGLVEFTLHVREMMLHLALIAAMLVTGQRGSPRPQLAAVGKAGAVLCIVLFAFAWWWCQFAPAQAAKYRELVGGEEHEENIRHLSRAITWQPRDPALREARGFARLMSERPGAMDDMETALSLNPRSSRLHESLGRVYWARGNREAAIELQREAIRLHSADPDRRLLMAEYLLQTGDLDGAREMVDSTEGLLWTRTYGRRVRDVLLSRIEEATEKPEDVEQVAP